MFHRVELIGLINFVVTSLFINVVMQYQDRISFIYS